MGNFQNLGDDSITEEAKSCHRPVRGILLTHQRARYQHRASSMGNEGRFLVAQRTGEALAALRCLTARYTDNVLWSLTV